MKTPPLLIAPLCALVLGACTLLTEFSLEGVSCHPVENPCLDGFACVDGECKAGVDAGFDCSACPSGECLPGTQECRVTSCEGRICAASYRCEFVGNEPTCISIPEGQLGQFCLVDADCRTGGEEAHQNRVCMRGAVPLPTNGRLRTGVCVEPCGEEDTCTTEGATCRAFGMTSGDEAPAVETRVCLPPTTLTACANDTACSSAQLVCTVFDHRDIGPITVCDQPLTGGAATGTACAAAPDEGPLCANGLCVPQGPADGQGAFCGELCGEGVCTLGTCRPVPFAIDALATGEPVVRYVPICVGEGTRCGECAAGPSDCGADAPLCVAHSGAEVCLGPCSLDADGPFQCPAGFTCRGSDGGGALCLPDDGC